MSNGNINHFTKSALTISEQIDQLINRGLIIADQDKVKQILSTVSYYRLSAYFKPYEADSLSHSFQNGIHFEHIWKTYVFDRELRLLVLDALERIEIALRTSLSNELSIRYGSQWYLNDDVFKKSWVQARRNNRESLRDQLLNEVNRICAVKQEEFIRHYYKKYSSPDYPPSWMIMECFSFGRISSLFRLIKRREDQRAVTEIFALSPSTFESLIELLRYTRNLCAHHSRLWNRWFLYSPKQNRDLDIQLPDNKHFTMVAMTIDRLLKSINPQSHWKTNVFQLMQKYETIPYRAMGFRDDWKNDPFWH